MKILYISPFAPWPPTSGASQRTNLLQQCLRRHGKVDLFLCPPDLRATNEDEAILRRDFGLIGEPMLLVGGEAGRGWPSMIPKPLARPLQSADNVRRSLEPNPVAHQYLRRQIGENRYHAVVTRYAVTALRLGLDKLGQPVRRIVDVDDVPWKVLESKHHAHRSRNLGSTVKGLFHRCYVRKLMLPRLQSLDHLWVANENNVKCFKTAAVSVLPNIPFGMETIVPEAAPAHKRTLLYVGSLGHGPNWEGLQWFLDRVWPKVRGSIPEAKFCIAGRINTGLEWVKWPGVTYLGRIDELSAAYRDCIATIAPVPWGGGTKIKVLESLAYQRPCVLSRHAWDGFQSVLEHGGCVLVADTVNEFAAACIQLLQSPHRARQMGMSGRKIVSQYFGRPQIEQEVDRVVARMFATGTKL